MLIKFFVMGLASYTISNKGRPNIPYRENCVFESYSQLLQCSKRLLL